MRDVTDKYDMRLVTQAEEIAALRAEVERLREALRQIATGGTLRDGGSRTALQRIAKLALEDKP